MLNEKCRENINRVREAIGKKEHCHPLYLLIFLDEFIYILVEGQLSKTRWVMVMGD